MRGESAITIDCFERRGLYELIRIHLGAIEDFWAALERGRDYAAAERLGGELADDFRLLRDIGWAEHDDREAFVVSMPAPELASLLRRLQDEAAHLLIERNGEAEPRRAEAEASERFRRGYEACERVLDGLGQRPEPRP